MEELSLFWLIWAVYLPMSWLSLMPERPEPNPPRFRFLSRNPRRPPPPPPPCCCCCWCCCWCCCCCCCSCNGAIGPRGRTPPLDSLLPGIDQNKHSSIDVVLNLIEMSPICVGFVREWNLSITTDFHRFALVPWIVKMHHSSKWQVFPIKITTVNCKTFTKTWRDDLTWISSQFEKHHPMLWMRVPEEVSTELGWHLFETLLRDGQIHKIYHSLWRRKRARHCDTDEKPGSV